MSDRRSRSRSALRALEEVRFGAERTLNLRATLPTRHDAVVRTEQWLRGLQAQQGGEVLIITGRGNQSPDGNSVVREAVAKLLSSLKRLGVVAAVRIHTPGSFVVTLAPMRALLESPSRHRGRTEPVPALAVLPGLDSETHALLARLAYCALDQLGVRDRESFLADEMRRQFTLMAMDLPPGARRDEHLRRSLLRALAEYEES